MKTILITGINGFLGSSLAKALKNNNKVIGLEYSLDNHFRLKNENFEIYSIENGIPNEIFKKHNIDIIVHAATFYGKSEAVSQMVHSNLFMAFELLDKSIKNNCQLFINSDTVLDRFTSAYALTKRQFQEWCYMRRNEIKVVNMQLEHFYGPGASPTNFITTMLNRLNQNETSIDLTAGEQERDFIYIDDVVSAYTLIINRVNELKKQFSIFQVCSGELISIQKLMLLLKEKTQSRSNLNFGVIPYRRNELMKSYSDNSRLKKYGWQPKETITSGILKTIKLEIDEN